MYVCMYTHTHTKYHVTANSEEVAGAKTVGLLYTCVCMHAYVSTEHRGKVIKVLIIKSSKCTFIQSSKTINKIKT